MIILDTTTRKLQAFADATATTTESPIVVSWDDITTTSFTPGASQTITSGNTAVDIVAAPAASTQRAVKFISVYNADTTAHTFTFRYNDNGTTRIICSPVLAVGQSAVYSNGDWNIYPATTTANGNSINALTNPHGIVFQRGAKTITNATASYGVDRWKGILSATTVTAGTWGQKTSAPNGSTGFAHGMLSASWTGAAALKYRQGIEAKDGCKFASQTAIFSANIYQDTGSAVTVTMNVYYMNTDDAWDGNSSNITLIGGASTSVASGGSGTVINSGALSIPSNAVHGLVVEISVAALGTGLTTKNFYVTAAQLQLGSIVTTCEERAFEEELARCQRYFYARFAPAAGAGGPIGFGDVSTANATTRFGITFPVTMRIVPQFNYTGTPGHFNAGISSNNAVATSIVLNVIDTNSAWCFANSTFTGAASTCGIAFWNGSSGSSDGFLFDADF